MGDFFCYCNPEYQCHPQLRQLCHPKPYQTCHPELYKAKHRNEVRMTEPVCVDEVISCFRISSLAEVELAPSP